MIWLSCFISFLTAGDYIQKIPSTPPLKIEQTKSWYSGVVFFYNNTFVDDYAWFDKSVQNQDEIAGVGLIGGYNLSSKCPIEGRVYKSFLMLDYADIVDVSVFLKPTYKFDDSGFSLYGLIGVGYVSVEGENGKTPAADEVIGKTIIEGMNFQYGIGVSYKLDGGMLESNRWSVFVEYISYMRDKSMKPTRLYDYNPNKYDELSMNGLNLGILYHF